MHGIMSLAGGDPLEKFTNRTYKNKSIIAYNASDAKLVAIRGRQ